MPLPDVLDHAVLSRLLEPLGFEVLAEPEAVGDTYGFASTRAATTVAHARAGRLDVVVKVWDSNEHGLGEIEFYADWAVKLPIRLPVCHAMAATDDYGLVVLEDLRPFRQGDELVAVGRADACAVAETIGHVHRATTGDESPLPPPRFGRDLPAEWHDTRRVAYIDRFGLPEHDLVRAIVLHSNVAEQVGRALWMEAPTGLTHSDLHLDNILFRAEGPVIVDWAHPGWGPAVHDLSSVLFSCTAIDDFDAAIAAHRAIVPTDDDQVEGAVLTRLVIATLGTALWIPSTPRQEELIENGRRRVDEVADWLSERRPALVDLLRG